jgi:hypothetical protein
LIGNGSIARPLGANIASLGGEMPVLTFKESTNSLTDFWPPNRGENLASAAGEQILAMQNQETRRVLQML